MSDRILTLAQAAPWAARSIHTLATHDGGAFTYTLTWSGTPVASVEDAGHGGPVDVRWHGLNWKGDPIAVEHILPSHKRYLKTTMMAYAAWQDLLASLPPVVLHEQPLTVDTGWLATEILQIQEIRKRIAKKLCFSLPDGKEYALSGPITPEGRRWILRKHPNATILNDLWAPVPVTLVPDFTPPAPAPTPAPVLTLAEMIARSKADQAKQA